MTPDELKQQLYEQLRQLQNRYRAEEQLIIDQLVKLEALGPAKPIYFSLAHYSEMMMGRYPNILKALDDET